MDASEVGEEALSKHGEAFGWGFRVGNELGEKHPRRVRAGEVDEEEVATVEEGAREVFLSTDVKLPEGV